MDDSVSPAGYHDNNGCENGVDDESHQKFTFTYELSAPNLFSSKKKL